MSYIKRFIDSAREAGEKAAFEGEFRSTCPYTELEKILQEAWLEGYDAMIAVNEMMNRSDEYWDAEDVKYQAELLYEEHGWWPTQA